MRFVEFSKHHVSVTCSWLSRIKTNIYPLSCHVVHQPLRCIAFASFEQLVSRCLIGREQTIVLQMHFAFSKCRFMSPPSILPPYVRQPPSLFCSFALVYVAVLFLHYLFCRRTLDIHPTSYSIEKKYNCIWSLIRIFGPDFLSSDR